jgi:ribosomal protein L7Ae-like RNA K-turn-binding protein
MDNKIYLLIGLSTKAGRLTGGEDAVEKSIKSLKAQLVIVAEDASDNTRKKFMDICKYTPLYQVSFPRSPS